MNHIHNFLTYCNIKCEIPCKVLTETFATFSLEYLLQDNK